MLLDATTLQLQVYPSVNEMQTDFDPLMNCMWTSNLLMDQHSQTLGKCCTDTSFPKADVSIC